jgi:hypothetical protein
VELKITISVDAPKGWRRRALLYLVIPLALVAATAAIASAGMNPIDASWIQSGGNISASKLSGNLSDLQTQLTNLQSPTVVASGGPFQGNFGGYLAANNVCGTILAGSHICTSNELLRYSEHGGGEAGGQRSRVVRNGNSREPSVTC